MTSVQQMLLENFDALVEVGGACLRPEDCTFGG
jgi:hypothetical protein